MMAYYYGWTDSEMMSMVADDFQDYWLAIPVIEAQESLINIRNESFTWMNKPDREKLHRELNKKAKSIIFLKDDEELSLEEAAKQLAQAMMNG